MANAHDGTRSDPLQTGMLSLQGLLILTALFFVGGAAAIVWIAAKPEYVATAIGASIALLGTTMTSLATVAAARMQATTAKAVAKLAGELDEQLQELKARADEQLARLKAQLDADVAAHRELCGAAAVYFFALRSAALQTWNDDLLNQSETGMVQAARYLIHVEPASADGWDRFWHEAQRVRREAAAEPDLARRQALLASKMEEQVPEGSPTGRRRLSLRDHYASVAAEAQRAIAQLTAGTP